MFQWVYNFSEKKCEFIRMLGCWIIAKDVVIPNIFNEAAHIGKKIRPEN